MRPLTWLHISDFHFREEETWAQNTVLRAMLDDIQRRCDGGLEVDFVLITGDIAYSGDVSQYALAALFLSDLSKTVNLPLRMIFCVPGNHDVKRDYQKACFLGARQLLQSENEIYTFLADRAERQTLLLRQRYYIEFQEEFFCDQHRTKTEDNLGYVSTIEIDDLRIAILGINSAWLSEGGPDDERHLLIGESQVENAIDVAAHSHPHLTISMQHHPFDYLKRYDQRTTQNRLEQACHIIHSGHLHEPQASEVSSQSSNCICLTAGASYESRRFRNAYTVVTLDPLYAKTNVTFVQYNPNEGSFSYEAHRSYIQELSTETECTAGEVAAALAMYYDEAAQYSHYLSSLLLGQMSDVPVKVGSDVVFGAPAFGESEEDGDLSQTTEKFRTIGRAINLLYGRKTLDAILGEHGAAVVPYVDALRRLSETNKNLSEQLLMRNEDGRRLAGMEEPSPFGNTLALMDDLFAAGEWEKLQSLAERCAVLDDTSAATYGKRMMALCLARSHESDDRARAKELYRTLTRSSSHEAGDWAGLANLLIDEGNHPEAKATILDAIAAFPAKSAAFAEIGMKVVSVTGDKSFRDQLRV